MADKEGINIDLQAAEILTKYCNGKPGNIEVLLKRIGHYSYSTISYENINEVIEKLGYGKNYPLSLSLADKFNKMNGIEFENWVADYFKKQGFDVRETKSTGDHGIDLFLYQSNDLSAAIQCKCWDGVIGEPIIREFYGSLLHSKAPLGYIFTSSSFTQQAINFAQEKPIKLIDIEALIQMA